VARTCEVEVNINLARKPSGCVLWIQFEPATMALGPFLWFGGAPKAPSPSLGDKVGNHSKGDRTRHKAERPNARNLAKRQLKVHPSMDAVARTLFRVNHLDPQAPAQERPAVE